MPCGSGLYGKMEWFAKNGRCVSADFKSDFVRVKTSPLFVLRVVFFGIQSNSHCKVISALAEQ